MLTESFANQFASQWIQAWNSHDINRIMEHYADDLEFHSPLIKVLSFNTKGIICTKDELARYFGRGLQEYPDLQFNLLCTLAGNESLVIYYQSVKERMAAEYFRFNNQGKVMHVRCHYGTHHSLE